MRESEWIPDTAKRRIAVTWVVAVKYLSERVPRLRREHDTNQLAANEVDAGRSQMMIFAGGPQYAKEPRVRMMGVTSMKRSKFLPDVPTINENGLSGYEFDTWYGLLAPSSTPRSVIARINAEVNKLLQEPLIIERLAKQSLEPLTLSPEEFDQLVRSNFEKMSKVVAISGAKVE